MSYVIDLTSRRRAPASSKPLPKHAGVILFFEKKPEAGPDDSKDAQFKLFRRIRTSTGTVTDAVAEVPLLEVTKLS
jgi:hypothetical protein